MTFEQAKKLLKKRKQGHLLGFWKRLGTGQRRNLLEQIGALDSEQIPRWAKIAKKSSGTKTIRGHITPARSYGPRPVNAQQERKYTEAIRRGKKLIRQGKVAAFVVAGGQGTRLKFDGPKGNYPISPVKKKTLFQIFAETIAAVSKKYDGVVCPWYIMTSPLNYEETKAIFRSNDHYGLGKENVFIFQQGTLPNFSFYGKIFMEDKGCISYSPDGHGGSLKALYRECALKDMKQRGVELISYWQVDNPLVNIFDPLFIGLHVLDEAEMSSKAVMKAGSYENVGNFCLVNGKLTVVEYSEFNKLKDSSGKKLAQKLNPDGSLKFHLGSIAIHIINRTFVERLNDQGLSLPLHRAVKKIPHIDRQGKLIKPKRANGIKLERFIFDALPLASKSIILETLRSEEFAPVKNLTSTDSVESARQMMSTRAADQLESVGVPVPRKADGTPDAVIEIAPSLALEKDKLKRKASRIRKIKPKDKLYLA